MTKSTRRSRYSPALAGDALGEFGKLRAFGLAHIEDIGGAESNQNGLILRADVLLGFLVLLAANADHGSENADAVLALLDLAAKLVPRIEASNAGCVRLLPCNLQNVAKAVIVKPAHCGEVGGEGFGVSLLQLLDQGLHVGGDYFFRGLLLLLVGVGGGLVDGCGGGVHGCFLLGLLHLAFALESGAACTYMPNASWRRRG